MRSRLLPAAALLCAVLLSTGCWDHQPPEESAFVHMLGIDRDPENPEQLTVTQLIAIPSALLSGGANGGQPEGKPFYLTSSAGPTVEGAQLASMNQLSRLPRLEHMAVLVLSEEFARKGVSNVISWALRHPQVRPAVWLVVSEPSAQMLLDAQPALDPLAGAALTGLMRNIDRVPTAVPMMIYQFAQTLLAPRKDGFIPLVRRVDVMESQVPPGFVQDPWSGLANPQEAAHSQVQIIGMAIFKGDRMVGKLTGPDASGFVWLGGQSKAPVSVPHPGLEGRFLSALTIKSSAKHKAELRGEQVMLTIEVRATMDAWEAGTLQPLAIGRYTKEIEAALAHEIKSDVKRTMQALQSLRADVFGFDEQLYRSAPQDWKRISAVWDDLYEQAKIEVSVDVHLRRSGLAR